MTDHSAKERRRFKRVSSNSLARIRARTPDAGARERLETAVRNISLGGVFIETENPFAVGTVVDFDMSVGDQTVEVTGMVRWADGKAARPGMGIQFLKVSRGAGRAIREESGATSHDDLADLLTSDPMRRGLLRARAEREGQSVASADLIRELDADPGEFRGAVGALAGLGILTVDSESETITFGAIDDLALANAVADRLERAARRESESPDDAE